MATQASDQPYERVNRSLGKIFLHNFLGGIAWGLGVTVGLSILLGALGYFVSQLDVIPIIGQFIKQATQPAIEGSQPRIRIETNKPTPKPVFTESLTPTP